MGEDRTQIILIGGPPGAGKSTLGKSLAARLNSGYLTVDDLLVAARVVTTEESHPEFHQARRAGGHAAYFTRSPKEVLISDALALEAASWPIVERVISAKLMSRTSAVIDWWLLRPEAVSALDDARIASVWLHLDPGTLVAREQENTEFLEGSPDPDRMLDNFISRSLWRNELIAHEAQELGLPVLHLTGREPVDGLVDRVVDDLGLAESH